MNIALQLTLFTVGAFVTGILFTILIAAVSPHIREFMSEEGRGEVLVLSWILSFCLLMLVFYRP